MVGMAVGSAGAKAEHARLTLVNNATKAKSIRYWDFMRLISLSPLVENFRKDTS
jgi:hypothetical protein